MPAHGATGWIGEGQRVRKKLTASKLQVLTRRDVQSVPEGDHSAGGVLLFRVRGVPVVGASRYCACDKRIRFSFQA